MGNLGGTFDATGVKPREEFKTLDPGDYIVAITKSGVKETEKKDGSFLELEMDVLEGPAKGRKLFDNLNLNNPNAQAVEIAKATLSAICHAVGKLTVSDSSELHSLPMVAVVKVAPKKVNGVVVPGEFRNNVATYKPKGAAVAGAPVGGGAATGGTEGGGAATGGLPWQKPAA